jgi:hypothetical protein
MRIKLQENFHHLSGRLNRDRDVMTIGAAMSRHDMPLPETLYRFENYKAYYRLISFLDHRLIRPSNSSKFVSLREFSSAQAIASLSSA